jgi:hypothetical protein
MRFVCGHFVSSEIKNDGQLITPLSHFWRVRQLEKILIDVVPGP